MSVMIQYGDGVLSDATSVLVASPTLATAIMPPGSAGAVDVILSKPGVPSGRLAGGFTYFDPSTAAGLSLKSGGAANLRTAEPMNPCISPTQRST